MNSTLSRRLSEIEQRLLPRRHKLGELPEPGDEPFTFWCIGKDGERIELTIDAFI